MMNQDILPISEYQKRFFLEWALAPTESTYNVSFVNKINGNLDLVALKSACDLFCKRHEVLHARYNEDGSQCYSSSYSIDDFYHVYDFKDDKQINLQIKNLIYKPFDLTKDVLIQFYLLSNPTNNQEHYFVVVASHIIADAMSGAIFMMEVSHSYNQLISTPKDLNQHINITTNTAFTQTVLAEQQILTEEYNENSRKFWLEFISDLPLTIDLPYKSIINSKQFDAMLATKTGVHIDFAIKEELVIGLGLYVQEVEATLFIVLSAIYGVVLSKYTNQEKLFLSYPINMRPRSTEPIVGCFVNNVPLKIELDKYKTFNDLVRGLSEQRKNTKQYQGYSLTHIINDQRQYNQLKIDNYFNVGFVQTNLNLIPLNFKGLNVEAIEMPWSESVANDFMLKYDDSIKGQIKFRLEYKKDLFSVELVNCFIESFRQLITDVVEQTGKENIPPIILNKYCVLSSTTYHKVINIWNKTEKAYPEDKTIHQLFEEQVKRTPNNIAVEYEDIKLTYKELNERSNQLANYLYKTYKIKPDDLITLCLDRSEYLLIAILGVLKSGGAYVPIAPTYPEDRISYILSDTKSKVLLTNQLYEEKLQLIITKSNEELKVLKSNQVISILSIDSAKINKVLRPQSKEPVLLKTISSRNLAYVIYTSGTTGKPKGVMLEHRGVVNRIKWMNNTYPLTAKDKILQKTAYVFDVSVWELFWANWYGACIVFAKPEGHKDSNYLISLIDNSGITIMHFVPSMLSVFEDSLQTKLDQKPITAKMLIPSLRYIFCSGEALSLNQVQRCHKLLPRTKLYNLYGPTEASVDVLNYDCNNKDISEVYIGKPIDNTSTYVLDINCKPIPIGAVGELYIGGVQLARGYLNLPELTADKFIANPFQTEEEKQQGKNARLYKTGDLVRYLPDGNIEYVGRNDFQVKIRGYRIELGEIESKLLSYPEIKQAVVLANEYRHSSNDTGNKYLVGYYVSGIKLNEDEILNYLTEHLPEYMVPSVLLYLDKLPLTINGKLDKNALPEAVFTNQSTYVGPSNELESQVCNIFAEILGLDVDKVGINDNFFKLGGNSILAIKLVSKLNTILDNSINVATVFKEPTVVKLLGSTIYDITAPVIITVSQVGKVEDQLLSFAQERLWFIDKFEQKTNAYNIPMVFKLSVKTDLQKLEESILSIVDRHEILRTVIKESNGVGYQLVKKAKLKIQHIKASSTAQLRQMLTEDANGVYDLANEYPIRVVIYNNKEDKNNYLSIVIHHIAFDGWSVDVFLKELEIYYSYYEGLSKNKNILLDLSELEIQYKDFALWQRDYLSGTKLEEQLSYWMGKLAGYESLNLMTDKPRPININYSGADVYFTLDKNISNKLRNLAKELSLSLYSVLLGGFYLLLRSYTNQDDIVIGSPIANRNYSHIENLIGFFVNTLGLRSVIDGNETLKNYIGSIGKEVIQAQLHQDLPFERLVEELKVEQDTSRHPIFQVLFSLQSFGNNIVNSSILEPYFLEDHYKVAKFDLSVMLDDSKDSIEGVFNYATSLYNKETIERFISIFKVILNQISDNTNRKIKELSYLDDNTYKIVIKEWNKTEKAYSEDKTIHQLFEEQVTKTPNNIAVVYEDKQLTYKELNERSNQLANYLYKTYKINPDDLITLCLDRSEYLLIAILGVLKSGGAYVPIAPTYPEDRISYILSDTKSKVLLTSQLYEEKLQLIISRSNEQLKVLKSNQAISILSIDSAKINKVLHQQSKEPVLLKTVSSKNLAYVIYTSGTTGKPKGVMVEHGNVISLVQNVDYIDIQANDNFLLLSNIAFDAATFEIWGAVLNSARLIIPKDNMELVENCARFSLFLSNMKISILWLTKTLFDQLYGQDKRIFKDIKYLLVGGEALDTKLIKDIVASKFKPLNLINGYGPTENTTFSCAYNVVRAEIKNLTTIPVGSPISNRVAYVLNKTLNLLPIGAIGELYVGGSGLARGYLNHPNLTSEKFIANPFQNEKEKQQGKNSRLYKTGDLVRYLPGGNIEYIGRNDFQVKIRGYRIELGEIEHALSNYPGIKQAVILLCEHKLENENDSVKGNSVAHIPISSINKYLVGYYVSKEKLDEPNILDYLSEYLPEYMIPNVLVYLEQLPLTINGKLDRKALPDPEFKLDGEYVAPRTELESKVCNIFADVVGLDASNIGINADFFRLGGDSIVSIQLVSRLRQRLNINISVKDIFTHKTVAKLFDNVIAKNQINQIEIRSEQGILSGNVPLLPIQEWYIDNVTSGLFSDYNHWNQSFLIKTPKLDIEKLRRSITTLIEYHDCFRLRYKKLKNKYLQYYDDKARVEELKLLNIKGLKEAVDIDATFTKWQSNFDLVKGPLYSIGYIEGYADGSSRVFFALHHMLVDGISWRILLDDLHNLYLGNELGNKGTSYRQWVEIVKSYKDNHQSENAYWNEVRDGYEQSNNQLLELMESETTRSVSRFELTQNETTQLIKNSNNAYHTEINDILLTAFAYALKDLTSDNINYIVLEGHGREEIASDVDITGTLGWFTTMYPVKLEIGTDIATSIKSMKECLRDIPNKGIGYGSIIGYKEDLPRISFNYLGQFDKHTQDQMWSIAEESSGISVSIKNEDKNILNVNGFIINGKLSFSIGSKLNKTNTTKLAKLFKVRLNEIIAYTSSVDRSYLTRSDIDRIIAQDYLDKLQEKKEIIGVYFANSLQQGFIYHALNQGDIDDAYKVQLIWEYATQINVDKLKQSWEYAQEKFPSLRLRFNWDSELVQIIDKVANLNFKYIDLSKVEVTNRDRNSNKDKVLDSKELKRLEQQLQKIIKSDRQEAYDLTKSGLFRIYIVKQQKNKYSCIFSSHHSILDGWSNPVLLNYVHTTYLQLLNNELITTQVEQAYTNSQKYLQGHNQDSFWNSYLAQIEDKPDLSGLLRLDKRNSRLDEYKHILEPTAEILIIKDKLYVDLKQLTQESGLTLNAVLQYVWHKILRIYGNTDQTVVGMTVSGRNIPIDNIEQSVGLYINTLPIIVNHDDTKTILDAIKSIQDNINEINSNSNINLSKLQKGGERLFNSLFVYENYPISTTGNELKKLRITFKQAIEKLDYPLSVTAYEENNQIVFKLKYAGELFESKVIRKILQVVNSLLLQIANKITETQLKLKYLDTVDYNTIVKNWNKTSVVYPKDKTIDQLFEEQARKTPNNIAVVYEDQQLTYKELNERSNQLANYLRKTYLINSDNLIALCLDRSEQMPIAILGVLKSGGAYVPIDPSYPNDRIDYILSDTKSKVLLTNEIYEDKLHLVISKRKNQDAPSILCIDSSKTKNVLNQQAKDVIAIKTISSSNLAYVIYTSGTTGKPKGVMIEHTSVVSLLLGLATKYEFKPQERFLLFANYVFDASVEQLFLPIVNGASLYIVNQLQIRDVRFMSNFIFENKINHIHATPSYLQELDYNLLTSVSRVISAGERLPEQLLQNLRTKINKVYNKYGPTETTVSALISSNSVFLGRPLSNVRVYILDKTLNPVPIGAIGELYIGGIGLARGYLNLPDLTKERFIVNPFHIEKEKQQRENSRLYKTGDLVRYLADGNIEYIGRNDFQVKIRGYRIELGEIENRLLSYPGIKQAIVLAKAHKISNAENSSNQLNTKYLVGYYVSDTKLDELAIVNYLSQELAEYMLPSILVHLDQLPLTVNGKLDRKALPDPTFKLDDGYLAPRTELESQVSSIFAEVLGTDADNLGINADFFKLGGDSIVSIQLVSRLRQRLNINVSVKDVFTHKTVAKLFDNVISKSLINQVASKSEQGILSGNVPLLPIQEWFISRVISGNFTDHNYWNQSFLIKTAKLDIEKLKQCIIKLIAHHDCFRLRYKKLKNKYVQYYADIGRVEELKLLNVKGLKAANIEAAMTKWQSNFDLVKGPLYSIGYIEGYADGNSRVFFALHHMLVDVISWRILANDLQNLYLGNELGDKGTSYRQWVEIVKGYKENHKLEVAYWNSINNELKQNNIKLLSLLESETTQNSSHLELTKEETRKLLIQSNNAYHTEINDILLTAFAYALQDLTSDNVNYILLEGHGREEIASDVDITGTLGWFTTMYPVKLEISTDIATSIKSIKESLQDIPNKGIGYGSIIGYTENLPRISFNYLGQFGKNNSEEDQYWKIVEDSSGVPVSSKNQDRNILNINGLIINGKLSFNIRSKLNKVNTTKLAKLFKSRLNEIIDHASNLDRSYLTVSDIDKIITQTYLDKLQQDKELVGIYLANSLQQGFIYHALNQDDDIAYHVNFILTYNNRLDIDIMQNVWKTAIAKYPGLRVRFAWDDQLIQIIDKEQELDWYYYNLEYESSEIQQQKIADLKKIDRKRRYDLSAGNLFRVCFIKINEYKYTLMFSFHHALLDGWSMPLLFGYVHKTYLLCSHEPNKMNQVPSQLTEDITYLASQKYIQDNINAANEFWKNELALITDYPDLGGLIKLSRREVKLFEYKQIIDNRSMSIKIAANTYNLLNELVKENGITVNAVLQYVWHRILSIYGSSTTTIVGMTVSGRILPLSGIEESIGLYINTLPVIVVHNPEDIVLDALTNLQDKINAVNSNSITNLAKLQTGGKRIFENIYVYENYPMSEPDDTLKIDVVTQDLTKIDYPLGLTLVELPQELVIHFKYAGELFAEETIGDLLNTYNTLLQEVIAKLNQPVKSLHYLDDNTFKKVVHTWNQNNKIYPTAMPVHELFVEQVQRTPDNIAVVFGDKQLTYLELNQKSNQLAQYLQRVYGIDRDDLIALCLDRSEYIVIAILAIFKAGGAYVPIDPDYPDDRIKYIIKDTSTKVVLTNKVYQVRLQKLLGKVNSEIVVIDDIQLQQKLSQECNANLRVNNSSDSLAYVIYTSGTTGTPKGVMVRHTSLVCYIASITDILEITSITKSMVVSNYAFVLGNTGLYPVLLSGGEVHIIDKNEYLDSEYLRNYIQDNSINFLKCTPVYFESLLLNDLIKNTSKYNGFKLVFGGEACSNTLGEALSKYSQVKCLTHFCPTEIPVGLLCNTNFAADSNFNLIGKPLPNSTCYILDNYLQPVPIGAIGELYVGGDGLALGYLNQSQLTKERFIDNPLQNEEERKGGKNGRLYKTGDLVRYMQDGNVEFVGRNDFQVKIRGFRIELGEIENLLSVYPKIKHAIVLAKEHTTAQEQLGSNKYLAGYYVSDTKLNEKDIFKYLSDRLPEYMVPNILIWLEKLPLTTNGKLNRYALPEIEFKYNEKYVAPRNEIEVKVCEIFADVLGLIDKKVGITDDFFKLGGNSISAIRLVGRINTEYKSHLKIMDIFAYKTPEKIRKHIIQTKNVFQAVVKINATYNEPNMFMFHPAGAGCEVYDSIANSLEKLYSCYGIDNYNLYNKNKISSLYELAQYYLGYIDEIMLKTKQTKYHFFAWSLGGQIALQVALILEQRGEKNIKITILDSYIRDQNMISLIEQNESTDLNINDYTHFVALYGEDHVNRVMANKEITKGISNTIIVGKLKWAKICLFKAMRVDDVTDKLICHIVSMPDNNMSSICEDLKMLTIIKVEDANHHNIVDSQKILDYLLNT